MSDDGISVEIDTDMTTARERAVTALANQGFGVLTEIDIAATLKAKTPIGLLLPCNVVLRARSANIAPVSRRSTPASWSPSPATVPEPVATEARAKLTTAIRARTVAAGPVTADA